MEVFTRHDQNIYKEDQIDSEVIRDNQAYHPGFSPILLNRIWGTYKQNEWQNYHSNTSNCTVAPKAKKVDS